MTESQSTEALTQVVARLRAERDGLRRAMRNRALIEQAKGVLAERFSIDPEDAFGHLVEMSSRHNIKVADLAAAIVARQVPSPPKVSELDLPDDENPSMSLRAQTPGILSDVGSLAAEVQLLAARVESAGSFDEITRTLATATSAWDKPANVILLLQEADGALRLVGSTGLSAVTRSQWDRVPPIETIPAVAAVQQRAPVYLADSRAISERFPVVADHPHEALVALPLVMDEHAIGALEITWARPPNIDKRSRDHLFSLARPVAQRSAELSARPESLNFTVGDDEIVDATLVPLIMSALREPAVLLAPVHGADHRIVDFRAVCGSPSAGDLAAAERVITNSLVTALPDIGSRALLPSLTDVLTTGDSAEFTDLYIDHAREGIQRSYHVDLHAARLWDRVLVNWRVYSPAELMDEPFQRAEEGQRFGVFRWDLDTGEVLWSPGMYRLTRTDPRHEGLSIEGLAELVHEDSHAALTELATHSLRSGRPMSVDVRGTGRLAGRELRITAVAITEGDGDIRRVRGSLRDITDDNDGRRRPRPRRIMAAAPEDGSALDTIVTPLSPADPIDGFAVKGVSSGPRDRVLGCWHDTVECPDGSVMLLVGEVAEGDPATAQRLRHAAAGYAIAGMAPDELLATLNTLCCALEPGRTATVSVARLEPDSGRLTWAASGQTAPVFLRPDASANIRSGALGVPLGVTDGIQFQHNVTELAPGEQLVLYTESLVRSGVSLSTTFEALLAAAETATPREALDRLLERLSGAKQTELCLLMLRNDREPV